MKKYLKLIPALCLSFCDVANAAIDTGEVLYAERFGIHLKVRFSGSVPAWKPRRNTLSPTTGGRLLRLDTLHRKQVFDLHHCRAVITV